MEEGMWFWMPYPVAPSPSIPHDNTVLQLLSTGINFNPSKSSLKDQTHRYGPSSTISNKKRSWYISIDRVEISDPIIGLNGILSYPIFATRQRKGNEMRRLGQWYIRNQLPFYSFSSSLLPFVSSSTYVLIHTYIDKSSRDEKYLFFDNPSRKRW